jgi:hypothetical protein
MNSKKIVSIHQPNFVPWIGYFQKMVNSNIFIILDDVHLPKTGGSWVNRNLILNNEKRVWATIPIQKPKGRTELIQNVIVNNEKQWKLDYLNKIKNFYRKHEYFHEIYDFLDANLDDNEKSIMKINLRILDSICQFLNLNWPEVLFSSKFELLDSKNERIVSLVKLATASVYLSGLGAKNYLDESIFTNAGIEVIYSDPSKIEYPQKGVEKFVEGLSIVDALMNIGFKGVESLLD